MFDLDVPTTCIKNFEKYGQDVVRYIQGAFMNAEEQEAVLNKFILPDMGKPTLFNHINKRVSVELIRTSSVTLECNNYSYRPDSTVLSNEGMLIAGLRRIALVEGVNKAFLINNEHLYVLNGPAGSLTTFSV